MSQSDSEQKQFHPVAAPKGIKPVSVSVSVNGLHDQGVASRQ